jgi:hypothetical protein
MSSGAGVGNNTLRNDERILVLKSGTRETKAIFAMIPVNIIILIIHYYPLQPAKANSYI